MKIREVTTRPVPVPKLSQKLDWMSGPAPRTSRAEEGFAASTKLAEPGVPASRTLFGSTAKLLASPRLRLTIYAGARALCSRLAENWTKSNWSFGICLSDD